MLFDTENIEQQQSEIDNRLNWFAHLLINTATGQAEYHKYYKRAVELDKTYRALLNISETDIDVLPLSGPQKDLLKKFKRERTDAEFLGAIARIVSTTKGMLESIINIFNDTIKAVKPNPNTIKYTDQSGNSAVDDLKKKLGGYYGSKNIRQYCYQNYPKKAAHSFNNWHVTEIESTPTGNRPYPVEIEVRDALNWGLKNNRLQYLLAKKPSNSKKQGESFIIWLPFYTMELKPVSKIENTNLFFQHSKDANYRDVLIEAVKLITKEPQATVDNDITYYVSPNDERVFNNSTIYIQTINSKNADKSQFWALKIYPHLAPVVPATKFGYVEDLYSNGSINTSYLHSGIEAVMKAMQDNKVLEESKQNNAYPREAHYVRDCEDCGGSGSIEVPSVRDAAKLEKGSCTACGGTGKLRPRTATDVIEVPYPPNDIIMKAGGLPPLSNLSATFPSDMTTIEFLDKQLKQHEETLHRRIFRSVHFMTEKSYSTATEVEFDSRSTYGAINDCANHMSECIIFHTHLVALYLGMNKGLVFDFGIPSDLRNLSEVQIAGLIKLYTESGVPQFVRRETHLKLFDITYSNDPEASLKARLIAEHDPLFGLSETEKQMRMNSLFVSDEDKALSQNILRLFDDYPELLGMNDRKTREEFLRAKAKEILIGIKTQQKEQMDAMRQNQFDLSNLTDDL